MTMPTPLSPAIQPLPQLHGILVLNKPKGPTSTRCITQIKRLGQKKIGHAGTLDPMATGVLLVLLGQATKISNYLLEDGGKVYSGVLRLGQTSDTWDAEGQIVAETPWEGIGCEQIAAEIAAWEGLTEQAVPPYSAAKHEGQPLYKLARKGVETPNKVKRIQISQATVLEMELPFVRFRVACSSGTYIRSLAHSLGTRLGCGALLTELTREYSHPFGLDVACDLTALTSGADGSPDMGLLVRSLRPIREALPDWPVIELAPWQAKLVRNGQPLFFAEEVAEGHERALLVHAGQEMALVQRDGPRWTVLRGLWTD